MQTDFDKYLNSERDFHDRRYVDGDNRRAQMKYYWSVEHGSERFLRIVENLGADSDVLEYGCGLGSRAGELSERCRSFNGIDISPVAIERLRSQYQANNVSFQVMDGMNMTFSDEYFDLIFGSGIIHHLDTEACAREISRVLRPGGQAVFWEPLGLNPIINAYRWLTPNDRTADEHPLLVRDFRIMRQHFSTVEVEFYGLTSVAAVPLRKLGLGESIRDALIYLDELILKVPGVRMLAWFSLIRCSK